jgi:hypothetical protein
MASVSGGPFNTAIDMPGLMPNFCGNGVPE